MFGIQKLIMNMRAQPFGVLALVFFALSLLVFNSSVYAQYPGFGDPGSSSSSSGRSTGGFLPVQETVDGGKVPIGATGQVVIRFRNDTANPIKTGLVRLYPSSTISSEVVLNQCADGSLDSGAECAVALSVKALQAGPWRIEMLMTHNGRARLVAARLFGSVDAGTNAKLNKLRSDVESIPLEVDFGSLKDSQALVKPVVLRNITSKSIDITKIYIDASEQAGYSLKSECETLDAGQACMAMVTWSPEIQGRSSGVLVVEHSGPTGLTSVPLKGQFNPASVDAATVFPSAVPGRGLLVSSQTQVDFGSDVESASTITVSLVNAGDTDLAISDIKISGSDNGLGFKTDGCAPGDVLSPIEACPLTIAWSPTRVGLLFDDIQILHDGARGVLILPVRGDAISTVSQDQKSIVLTDGPQILSPMLPGGVGGVGLSDARRRAAKANLARVGGGSFGSGVVNPASVLDGYRITSFSADRAIINGPGGSRLVFDSEDIVLGGVPWSVTIQMSGIEFSYQGKRVLMLFDRSLSSINRVTSSASASASSSLGQ